MKAALIPPKGFEYTALKSDMHLVLPLDECRNNEAYLTTYRAARMLGHYIILDNGCAEGRLVDGDVLLDFAREIGAHEVVAPDVMGDPSATVGLTFEWLNQYHVLAGDFNIMAVLQGHEDPDDWKYVVKKYAGNELITTLGIPKIHVTHNGRNARVNIVEWVLRNYPARFKIHLLGLSGEHPLEVKYGVFDKRVRSMDSAQPYKVAAAGHTLNGLHNWEKRLPTYFAEPMKADAALVLENCRRFIEWGKMHESRAPGR